MKRFVMVSDIVFEAKDIDDAFRKLAEHFTCLADDSEGVHECDSQLIMGGIIEINPLE